MSAGASPMNAKVGPSARPADSQSRLNMELEPLLEAVLETVGASVMILDQNRQILLASRQLLQDLNLRQPPIGIRPGEALGCVHARDNSSGCGGAKTCSTCGTLLAYLQSQAGGEPVDGECLLNVRHGHIEEPREFRIRAFPIKFRGEPCTVISLTDISHQKRREALEKFFFHDILNTVQGLVGWSRMLAQGHWEHAETASKRVALLAERLSRDIEDHRALVMAEAGTLQVSARPIHPETILDIIEGTFANHEVARGKCLEVARTSTDDLLVTDESLATRVVANMVKNALEATSPGGTVRVWMRCDPESCEFCVWNAGIIPQPVAQQIFLRSFSTKAEKGRGIGTFSMKLFGERYLGGRVRFTSTQSEGTVFSLTLPRKGLAADHPGARS